MSEPQSSPFAVASQHSSGTVAVAQTKAAQEIQAALVVAKRFPRDQNVAYQRIMDACKRRGVAEEASYVYKRGGTLITGPTIRLLEVIFQQWGNCRSGVIELDQENGESRVESFAWDLETNAYDSKTFSVPHQRKADDKIVIISDPRDVYEHVANYAARRKRACMEAVIPRDIIDDAIAQCEKTLKSGGEPIADRIRKMVSVFAEVGVTVPMIEVRIGHKLDACIEQELVMLRKIYTSIKDGAGKREDFFDVNVAEASRPKFEGDDKEEAASGLAPEQAKGKGKGKVKSTSAGAPPAEPKEPVQVTAQGEAVNPEPPADAPVIDKVLFLCGRDGINETEVLEILKRKKLARPEWQQLVEVNDEHLKDVISSWDVVSAQVRIDRKAAAK